MPPGDEPNEDPGGDLVTYDVEKEKLSTVTSGVCDFEVWIIEGHGVDPDVTLDLGPDGFLGGKDVQLDYAIDSIMKEIAKDPRDLAPAPPIPPRPLQPAP